MVNFKKLFGIRQWNWNCKPQVGTPDDTETPDGTKTLCSTYSTKDLAFSRPSSLESTSNNSISETIMMSIFYKDNYYFPIFFYAKNEGAAFAQLFTLFLIIYAQLGNSFHLFNFPAPHFSSCNCREFIIKPLPVSF